MSSSGDDKPEPIAFGDRELSDVTLIVENQEFYVHKMVLASGSDVFKDLFFVKEPKQYRIDIIDVSPVAFQHLLELLYYGAVKNRIHLFSSFGGAAARTCSLNYYADPGLDELWSSDSNAMQLLKAAKRFNLTQLVMQELSDAFGQIKCQRRDCFRCICIYLFLVDKCGTLSVNRKFDPMSVASVAKVIAETGKRLDEKEKEKLESLASAMEHIGI